MFNGDTGTRRDQVFQSPAARASDFEFDAEVANVFDDMIARSVPCYGQQQNMIQQIGKTFWIPDTNVFDLGCSTATTLINLCREVPRRARFIGYDNSLPMLERGRLKIREQGLANWIDLRHGDLNGDLSKLALENASVVTMCWTLQFIRPLHRDDLIKWVHTGLVDGGVFVLTEKVLTNHAPLNRCFIDFYYEFKKRNGYSESEIQRKREALENVLIPYSLEENVEMLHRNGFGIVEPFFQWYNFAGLLCVKNSPCKRKSS
jgi:tRNA (cmo5U34)-methyltransferase